MKALTICLITILPVLFNSIAFATLSENEYLKQITTLSQKGENERLVQTAKEFFKLYPKSNFVADVRLILADKETSPKEAINQFKILVDKYRYFKQRDYTQYRICEIFYLLSKWNELRDESNKGIKLFNKSEYSIKFKFFLAKAYIYLEEFDMAKEACLDITKSDHSYNTLSDALILLSFINRSIYGLSRAYLYSLSEIISGFKDSANMPAALFLLGRYYESKGEYNKAYSAYSDTVRDFPKSPEAGYSKRQLSTIARYNPSRTDYIPDTETIKKTDQIDIQPEFDIDIKGDDNNKIQYSISLGPFSKINDAREIKNLIKKEFQPVEIAKVRNGYRIYTGRFSDIDSAASTKIRLAEEFGINGNIVRIIRDSKKMYIYEE